MSADAWMDAARCVTIGPRNWDTLDVLEQRAVCGGCDVRLPCTDLGIRVAADWGSDTVVFGGLPGRTLQRLAKAPR